MGLRNDYKSYKKRIKLLSFLRHEFGISEQDLLNIKNISALAEENKALKEQISKLQEEKNAPIKKVELSKQEKLDIENKYKGIATPEQIAAMFADEVEEFYPNGIDR